MKDLEQQFQKELISRCSQAQLQYGCACKRLLQAIEQQSAVTVVREMIRRHRMSYGFETLQAAKRLDLSVEALVAAGTYSALFSDDEVNYCFDLLCEYGYYG